jgi:hypothetical protein
LNRRFALCAPPPAAPPPQWLPGFVRWPIRAIVLPFLLLDLAIQRLVRLIGRAPSFAGRCDKRGDCCRYILVPMPRFGRFLAELYVTQIHGFYRAGFGVEDMDVFRCRYLQSDGLCSHYHPRPSVCRQWPRWDAELLPGCGYRKKARLPVVK